MGYAALLLSLCFSLFLILRDYWGSPRLLPGFWVPLLWFLIIMSRDPGYWFNSGVGVEVTVDAYEDGNPLNRNIYLCLILLGIGVLIRRKVSFSRFLASNRWLAVFCAYCALSILWADYPFVATKAWVKGILGNVVMALIIVTNPEPFDAIKRLFRWTIYLFVPLSVVLSKYFPALGRTYHIHSGAGLYRGVTLNGNQLSTLCYILGLFLVWELLKQGSTKNKFDLGINLGLLGTVWWLALWGDGATGIVSWVVGVGTLLMFRFGRQRYAIAAAKHLGLFLCVVTPFLVFRYTWFLELATRWLGHTETLWGRLELWTDIFRLGQSQLFGSGIGSYWLGQRMATLWQLHWWHPTQAHNGYVENYITLGYVGLVFWGIMAAAIGRKSNVVWKPELIGFKLAFLFSTMCFNLTEAAFRGPHPIWFLFLLFGMDSAEQRVGSAEPLPAREPQQQVRVPLAVRAGGSESPLFRHTQIS